MSIQSMRITDQTDDHAVIEMLIANDAEAEISGEFLKFRVPIPCEPVPHVEVLQLVALRRVRELVDAQIQRSQTLLRQHHVDIP